MKDLTIASIEALPCSVPLKQAVTQGLGSVSKRDTVIVKVTTADGLTGYGEAYNGRAPLAVAATIDTTLRDLLTGLDAAATTEVWARFESRVLANHGTCAACVCAMSGIDMALWDVKGKALGLPLYRLLGAVRDRVPVYGSGGFTTYDEGQLRDQLSGWASGQRIPRVKIKIGESWGADPARDLDRMRQARAIIGDDVELFVDANGGYGRKQAIRVMNAAADLDVRWFEEPVSSDDLDGLREVRDGVRADVTAGEYGWDLYYFRRMCAAGAVDCLQADVSRCGGITEWLRVAAAAASYGLQISGHCAPHLHAHAAAAVPNLRHLEWFHDHVRIESLLFDGTLDPAGGTIRPDPAAPGLGLVFKAADAAGYRAG